MAWVELSVRVQEVIGSDSLSSAFGRDEARVTGRRSHERFQVGSRWAAVVRVSRDVWIEQNERGEFAVISRTPAAVDEHVTLTLTSGAGHVDLHMQVEESVPVIVEGTVRHELKLRPASGAGERHE